MERVFEPFFTTKASARAPASGSARCSVLPSRSAAGSPSNPSRARARPSRSICRPAGCRCRAWPRPTERRCLGRVLVVEDDELVAELAAGMLERTGLRAQRRPQREGGARPAHRRRPAQADLLRHRHARRDQRASSWRRKSASRFPELPILLTTGYSEEVGGTHGFPVLQKPYELELLAGALQKMLKRDGASALARFRPTKRRSVGCGKRPVACNGGGTCNKQSPRGHPRICGSSGSSRCCGMPTAVTNI